MSLLDEATKHIREAIMLGRTDIIKKLLEEVWCSLSDAKGRKYGLFFATLDICCYLFMDIVRNLRVWVLNSKIVQSWYYFTHFI